MVSYLVLLTCFRKQLDTNCATKAPATQSNRFAPRATRHKPAPEQVSIFDKPQQITSSSARCGQRQYQQLIAIGATGPEFEVCDRDVFGL